MVVKKISELVPKGAPLGNTDLLVVGVDNGFDYDLKSVTGAELLGNVVSQTITNGVTTKAPSENVVYDSLDLKVDKVTGKGLSTEDYTSAEKTKLSGLTGTNTGNQNLQEVTNLGNSTTHAIVSATLLHSSLFLGTEISTTTLANSKKSALFAEGYLSLNTTGTSEAILKGSNILNDITLEFPNKTVGSYTIATTTDLTNKVDSNTAITGATKTKITYDSKGLVTSGADATTSDISDSLNKRYVTDANLTVIGNTSGTNTGDQIISDATITTTDITTNNFTTAKHGFVPKGTNVGNFLKDDGTWGTPASGGLTYFTEAQNTASPNATVPVDSLTAVTGTTDGDFAIIPKGAGALISQIPDNTTTGGNKRGARAVDFQRSRSGANQVASGTDSAILSGVNNAALSPHSVVLGGSGNVANNTYGVILGGSGNLTSAQYTLAFGRNAYITGNYAFEFGNNGGGTADGGFGFLSSQTGNNATSFNGTATGSGSFSKNGNATGLNSVAFSGTSSGSYSFTANISNVSNGRASSAFGEFASTKGVATRISLAALQDISPYLNGNSQVSTGVVTTQTSTNTAISLLTYNGTIIALPLQNNEAIRVRGSIIGKQTTNTNVCCYDFDCVIVRGTTAGSTVIKVNNMNLVFDDIVCTVLPTLNADTTNGGLDIKSGAKTTTTIKWSCRIDSTEVILA